MSHQSISRSRGGGERRRRPSSNNTYHNQSSTTNRNNQDVKIEVELDDYHHRPPHPHHAFVPDGVLSSYTAMNMGTQIRQQFRPPRRQQQQQQQQQQPRQSHFEKPLIHKRGGRRGINRKHRHNSRNNHDQRRSSNNRQQHQYQRQHQRQRQHQHSTSNRRGNHYSSSSSRTQTTSLNPVHVSSSSIHCDWKTQLGGIIRYYINSRDDDDDDGSGGNGRAMKDVERMYFENKCNIEDTKHAILAQLGLDITNNDKKRNLVDISMAIETDPSLLPPSSSSSSSSSSSFEQIKSNQNIALLLKKEVRHGDGPAHSHEQWTNIIVPSWAIHKSYFFHMTNNTPLHLSCEMTIDNHNVAKNVPLPAHSIRNVRPDNARYFETHTWMIQPAKRVKLQDMVKQQQQQQQQQHHQRITIKEEQVTNPLFRKTGKRYNNIRPNYNNNTRVHTTSYPDATTYGWNFTGSCEQSKVEFFEKNVNLGIVKLDFYYTTATVKTTLCHASTGRNSLFRNTVSPQVYVQILENPRSHTNRGYRKRSDRPMDDDVIDIAMMDDSDNDSDTDNGNDDTNMDKDNHENNNNNANGATAPNFARNDDYDFTNDGHTNRTSAMARLEQTRAFAAWEEAARKEWACIHAKFYVSLPRQNMLGGASHMMKRREYQVPQQELPKQEPVIDVKSAERATLGTKFHAIGPSQAKNRSRIVMKRINGLNDDESRRAAPVFEYKLYYRAESEFKDKDELVEDDDDDDDDVDIRTEKTSDRIQFMVNDNEINEYKNEVIQQINNLHLTHQSQDHDEARLVLQSKLESISKATTNKEVDDQLVEYEMWRHKQWTLRKWTAPNSGL
jgi:hypothetical protein